MEIVSNPTCEMQEPKCLVHFYPSYFSILLVCIGVRAGSIARCRLVVLGGADMKRTQSVYLATCEVVCVPVSSRFFVVSVGRKSKLAPFDMCRTPFFVFGGRCTLRDFPACYGTTAVGDAHQGVTRVLLPLYLSLPFV